MKVKSSLVDEKGQRDLHAKYEEIYAQSDVWLYKKSHGVHSVIYGAVSDLLPHARVLDAGCGAGRLALMCATKARHVDGIDFSEAAVGLARLNAKVCGITQVDFKVADLDTYTPPEAYDIMTLVGVLEHVPNPVNSLRSLNKLMKPGGTLVVSCPNFLNFRGNTYMTLLTLLGLPMSLADLRQISYLDIMSWCRETGFELTRGLGAIYRFGWDQKAIDDMIKRVPLAIRDKKLPIELDIEAYNSWLRSQYDINHKYLEFLEGQGLLKRIQRQVTLTPQQSSDLASDLWSKMSQYLNEDIEGDPYYSTTEPFCYQGGEGIYLLRKVGSVS